jgi:hypothetical protein
VAEHGTGITDLGGVFAWINMIICPPNMTGAAGSREALWEARRYPPPPYKIGSLLGLTVPRIAKLIFRKLLEQSVK